MDADCVRITRHGRSARISIDVSGRRLMTAQDVLKVCDGLAQVMSELRTEDPGVNVSLDRLDFSQNALGNTAVATLTTALLQQHAGVPRVLLLWQNCISDAEPLQLLFATGHMHQLHLSGNKLPEKAMVSLVVAAVMARQLDGTLAYPFVHKQRKVPLWLRMENQRTVDAWNHGRFLDETVTGLQPAGFKAKDVICFVQGNCRCCPELCCCRATVPAVHLTYLNMPQLHGFPRPCWRTVAPPGVATNTPKCPTVRRPPGVRAGGDVDSTGGGRRKVEQTACGGGGRGLPDWLKPLPPPGLEPCRLGCCRWGESWPGRQSRQELLPHDAPPAVVEASAADFANNGNDFRAVTCDYVAEGSLCMSVKIGDMVVIGSATDYEGYIFALDTFKDKSGYIPVSALSA